MKYIIGNLIDLAIQGEFDVIAHGCNCFKNFGLGLALEIKRKLPEAYQADLDFKNPTLGKISIGFDHYENIAIVNCYTQYNVGKPHHETNRTKYPFDTAETRYEAIKSCMSQLKSFCTSKFFDNNSDTTLIPNTKIGLPLIGCGLAGLEWSKVSKIISEELNEMDVTVVVFNESERLKHNIELTK